jgi:hypothetical protein
MTVKRLFKVPAKSNPEKPVVVALLRRNLLGVNCRYLLKTLQSPVLMPLWHLQVNLMQ